MTKEQVIERLGMAIKAKVPQDYGMRIDEAREYASCVLAELKAIGLAVVPREPTREMCYAARDTKHVDEYVKLVEAESTRLIGDPVIAPAHGSMMGYVCWRAMIAASPYD